MVSRSRFVGGWGGFRCGDLRIDVELVDEWRHFPPSQKRVVGGSSCDAVMGR